MADPATPNPEAPDASGEGAKPAPPRGGVHLLALIVGMAVTLGAIGVLLAGPASYRMGMLDLGTATLGVATISFWVVISGAALLVVALISCLMQRKPRGILLSIIGLIIALELGFRIYSFQALRAASPPIHDVQTDWSHPVAFSEGRLQARRDVGAVVISDDARLPESAGRWAGKSVAEVQAEFYDLKPLLVGAKPPDATVAVELAAKRLGWLIMKSDPPGGELEAVHYSPWYGLGSDIAVRVSEQGTGSRIDVRSASRTLGSDMGANNQRITELLREVEFQLRGSGDPAPQPKVKPAS